MSSAARRFRAGLIGLSWADSLESQFDCRFKSSLLPVSRQGWVFMERWAIAIRGVVQGVGFRPFVYNLASGLDLRGFVKNRTGGVAIEVEGEASRLDQFLK